MIWPDLGDHAQLGEAMHGLLRDLYPIPRSITGEGVRETLRRLAELVPMTIHEIPSGTRVLDWTVPQEWEVRDAWVADPEGRRVVDFADSTLHLVGYSTGVRANLSLDELRPRLHTLPDHPDWIPYRTSYYERDWGFCMAHRVRESLPDGRYEVCIDARHFDGSLSYGEVLLEGENRDEVLISTHVCHPSLANDNLSGIVVATALARHISRWPERRYSYRFLFAPGTIGAIAWLAHNTAAVSRIRHGLVLSGVGYGDGITYKRSRQGGAAVDRTVEHVLRALGEPYESRPFEPYGYDERQYCSPGFDLPVGCFMRKPWSEYPEYHTSADNPSLVTRQALVDSYEKLVGVMGVLDRDRVYRNLSPMGEPQLGRRGLFRPTGGEQVPGYELALLWVLNQADGTASLRDIADRSGLTFEAVRHAAGDLLRADLLEDME